MATPSNKSAGMNALLDGVFNRTATIEADKCVMCPNSAVQFRDELSRKEYTISGMCQACQDRVFGR